MLVFKDMFHGSLRAMLGATEPNVLLNVVNSKLASIIWPIINALKTRSQSTTPRPSLAVIRQLAKACVVVPQHNAALITLSPLLVLLVKRPFQILTK